MVERASLAYEAEVDGNVYGPEAPRLAMRAALEAAFPTVEAMQRILASPAHQHLLGNHLDKIVTGQYVEDCVLCEAVKRGDMRANPDFHGSALAAFNGAAQAATGGEKDDEPDVCPFNTPGCQSMAHWNTACRSCKADQRREEIETENADAATPAAATGGERAGQWVSCSPALLQAGVDCDKTPRRPSHLNHEHFIAHTLPATPAGGGDGMLPDEIVPHSAEWYVLCERRFAVDRISISGRLAEAIIAAIGRLASAPAQEPSNQGSAG
jgi:hypothetical protein